ncbi:unnamed protein product [Citrullus colocynthis]|uniref:Uncharacterized protein n=1 Tax=Citrullus colocynthis TaxID=252529 RepID=A0ABP0Z813_9ROSI
MTNLVGACKTILPQSSHSSSSSSFGSEQDYRVVSRDTSLKTMHESGEILTKKLENVKKSVMFRLIIIKVLWTVEITKKLNVVPELEEAVLDIGNKTVVGDSNISIDSNLDDGIPLSTLVAKEKPVTKDVNASSKTSKEASNKKDFERSFRIIKRLRAKEQN